MMLKEVLLHTSATGKRVEIDSVNNNIRILDAVGNVLIELDDDSAVEALSGGVPVMGPGLRVGQLSGNNTSLSTRGLYVRNPATNKAAFVRPDGIYTDGDLNVWGATNLGGNLSVGGFISVDGSPGITKTFRWQAYNQFGTLRTHEFVFKKGILVDSYEV